MSSSKRKHSDDDRESENEGKSRNRSVTKDRERQWQTVDSSDDSQSSDGSSSDSDSSSGDDSDEGRKNKHRKESKDVKKSKKESKHKKSKKDKKDKDKKHHKKESKKSKKHKKEKKDKHTSISINQNEYGKYGIIKEVDIFHKQREFEVYMAEVRGVPGVMSEGKREVMQHFKTYMEDFNTATMPHEKFYNYERWEMAEYQRSKLEQHQRALDGKEFDAAPTSFNDEEIRRRELKQQKADAENKEFQQLKQKMASNKDIQGDMRRQAQLSTELQLAFKRGDSATVKRLERKLAPDEAKMTVKHPWA